MTTPVEPRAINILLVEDNPADARLVLEFLRDAGLARLVLTQADRLDQAVEHIRRGRFDAIILDLNLPDSSGLETFARAYLEASDAPILVLTGVLD
ncbi:MAG TPA: response regulator, partial [Gemmatimonadales bacterium]